jgi:hypothetical protein
MLGIAAGKGHEHLHASEKDSEVHIFTSVPLLLRRLSEVGLLHRMYAEIVYNVHSTRLDGQRNLGWVQVAQTRGALPNVTGQGGFRIVLLRVV